MALTHKMTSSKSILIVSTVIAYCCYQYLLRFLPNLIFTELRSSYNITPYYYGIYTSVYYAGYIFVHIPIGMIIDRVQPRILVPFSLIITTIGILPLVFIDNFIYCIIGRFLMGVGTSAATISAIYIYKLLFPAISAILLGVTVSVSLIFIASINSILLPFLGPIDFYTLTISIVFISTLLASLHYFYIPRITTIETSQDSLIQIFIKPHLLFLSVCTALMGGVYTGFSDSWGIPFLLSVHNVSHNSAEFAIGMLLLGMCIGCVLLPYLSDRYNSPIKISIFSGILISVLFSYMLTKHSISIELIIIIFFTLGLCSAQQVVMISKIYSTVPKNLSGLAGSISNTIIMIFGLLFHILIGNFLEQNLEGVLFIKELSSQEKNFFCNVMSIIPICTMIGSFLLVLTFKQKSSK